MKITLLFALTYFKMNIMEPLLSMVMTGAPILSILKVTTWNPSKQGQKYDHVVLFSQRMPMNSYLDWRNVCLFVGLSKLEWISDFSYTFTEGHNKLHYRQNELSYWESFIHSLKIRCNMYKIIVRTTYVLRLLNWFRHCAKWFHGWME